MPNGVVSQPNSAKKGAARGSGINDPASVSKKKTRFKGYVCEDETDDALTLDEITKKGKAFTSRAVGEETAVPVSAQQAEDIPPVSSLLHSHIRITDTTPAASDSVLKEPPSPSHMKRRFKGYVCDDEAEDPSTASEITQKGKVFGSGHSATAQALNPVSAVRSTISESTNASFDTADAEIGASAPLPQPSTTSLTASPKALELAHVAADTANARAKLLRSEADKLRKEADRIKKAADMAERRAKDAELEATAARRVLRIQTDKENTTKAGLKYHKGYIWECRRT